MYRADTSEVKVINVDVDRQVRIRPLESGDAERFYWFLGGMSEEDRRYLRIDIRDRNLVIERVHRLTKGRDIRLIAETDDEIMAEASLETHEAGWEEHVGEMRLLVAPDFRGKGLGRALAREIYMRAFRQKVTLIVAKIMRPQTGARRILRHFGFTEDAVLPHYVRDQAGQKQDLFMMTLDLEALRADLRLNQSSLDFRRHR